VNIYKYTYNSKKPSPLYLALFAEELYKKSGGPACKGALQKEGSVYKRFLVLELER